MPPTEEPALAAALGSNGDAAESIVCASCDRTSRTVRAIVLTAGTRSTIDVQVVPVDGATSRIDFVADVRGGSLLVRSVLRVARRFAEAGSDALAEGLVRDFEREATGLGGVRLSAGAPAVIQLRRLEPEPPIPRIPRLAAAVASFALAVAFCVVMVCGVWTVVLGFATAMLTTAVLVIAAVVALVTLGPRQVRRRAETAGRRQTYA